VKPPDQPPADPSGLQARLMAMGIDQQIAVVLANAVNRGQLTQAELTRYANVFRKEGSAPINNPPDGIARIVPALGNAPGVIIITMVNAIEKNLVSLERAEKLLAEMGRGRGQ
jgi:hypothetical protein